MGLIGNDLYTFSDQGFVFDMTKREKDRLVIKDIIYPSDGKEKGIYVLKPELTKEEKEVFSEVLNIPIDFVNKNIR